jgi:hypothetical protein
MAIIMASSFSLLVMILLYLGLGLVLVLEMVMGSIWLDTLVMFKGQGCSQQLFIITAKGNFLLWWQLSSLPLSR